MKKTPFIAFAALAFFAGSLRGHYAQAKSQKIQGERGSFAAQCNKRIGGSIKCLEGIKTSTAAASQKRQAQAAAAIRRASSCKTDTLCIAGVRSSLSINELEYMGQIQNQAVTAIRGTSSCAQKTISAINLLGPLMGSLSIDQKNQKLSQIQNSGILTPPSCYESAVAAPPNTPAKLTRFINGCLIPHTKKIQTVICSL